ncbi:MAG: hypothetical protein Q8P67_18680 [archaeon]|nr:hypothetical protein [archaeon]
MDHGAVGVQDVVSRLQEEPELILFILQNLGKCIVCFIPKSHPFKRNTDWCLKRKKERKKKEEKKEKKLISKK